MKSHKMLGLFKYLVCAENMSGETDVEFSTSVILRFIYTRSSTKNW